MQVVLLRYSIEYGVEFEAYQAKTIDKHDTRSQILIMASPIAGQYAKFHPQPPVNPHHGSFNDISHTMTTQPHGVRANESEQARRHQKAVMRHKVVAVALMGFLLTGSQVVIETGYPAKAFILLTALAWFSITFCAVMGEFYWLLMTVFVIQAILVAIASVILIILLVPYFVPALILAILFCTPNGFILNSLFQLIKLIERD